MGGCKKQGGILPRRDASMGAYSKAGGGPAEMRPQEHAQSREPSPPPTLSFLMIGSVHPFFNGQILDSFAGTIATYTVAVTVNGGVFAASTVRHG